MKIINNLPRKLAIQNTIETLQETTLTKTGDSADNTLSFTSADSASPTAWTNVDLLNSGEKHSSILNKISTMFQNVRYLYKILGTTDISAIGNGSCTGAIAALKSTLTNYVVVKEVYQAAPVNFTAYAGMTVIFNVPAISGYKCILGICGTSENGNIIPHRPSAIPSNNTVELYMMNVFNVETTLSYLHCNLVYIRV